MLKTLANPFRINDLQPSSVSPEPSTSVHGSQPSSTPVHALHSALATEILKNIELTGDTTTQIKLILNGNLNHVLNLSSGTPRIQTNVIKKFNLILSQPLGLSVLNPFEVRCCLCHRVISYPCWYYEVKYAVNHFHYFVCFSASRADKVSVNCYRRSV